MHKFLAPAEHRRHPDEDTFALPFLLLPPIRIKLWSSTAIRLLRLDIFLGSRNCKSFCMHSYIFGMFGWAFRSPPHLNEDDAHCNSK